MGDNCIRFCDLKEKEVINICDCKKLGYVADLHLDICNGCIIDIIVPGPGRLCGIFGRDTEYIIPWRKIKQIGEDIILVEINPEDALVKFPSGC